MNSEVSPWVSAGGSGGQCVQVRQVDDQIEVRDGGDGERGPVLRFTREEWAAWLDGAKSGEFDHLT